MRERKPEGSDDSRSVYHSMRRGNKGNGIVKAKRSRTRDKKTMVSTLAMDALQRAEGGNVYSWG